MKRSLVVLCTATALAGVLAFSGTAWADTDTVQDATFPVVAGAESTPVVVPDAASALQDASLEAETDHPVEAEATSGKATSVQLSAKGKEAAKTAADTAKPSTETTSKTTAGTAKEGAEIEQLAAQEKGTLNDNEIYVIKSQVSPNKVVDVKDGRTANGANVQSFESNMTMAQKWRVKKDAKGYVTFINMGSGKTLDVSNGNGASGTNVQQWESNGTPAQKWIVQKVNGSYRIISALSKGLNRLLVLDVSCASTQNGANIQLYADNGTAAQRWQFLSTSPAVAPSEDLGLSDKWYTISSSINEAYCLDVASGSRANGSNLQLYVKNGTSAQLFKFVYSKDGNYSILNAKSNTYVDVDCGNLVPGTNVQIWEKSGVNQRFSIIKNSDGTYSFVSWANGLYLDAANGIAKNGTNVQTYYGNATSAQKFRLRVQKDLMPEGLFAFMPSYTSKVLDVKNGSTSPSAAIQIFSGNGTLAQKWYVRRAGAAGSNLYSIQSLLGGKYLAADGDKLCRAASVSTKSQWVPSIENGHYVLVNKKYGKVLDVEGAGTSNGTTVQMYVRNHTAAQRFDLLNTPVLNNGTYFLITALKNSMVVDVAGGSPSNGTNIQLYTMNESGAQKWTIAQNGDGSYSIINAMTGKSLDITDGRIASGVNVQQFKKNGSKAQKWRISWSPSGYFLISSAENPKIVLDVTGGNAVNGANIQVYSDNGTAAQGWSFLATSYSNTLWDTMLAKAQNCSSSTRWLILVNTDKCKVGIYSGSKEQGWVCEKYWDCSPGAWETPTVKGVFTVQSKGYVFGSGYSCYYYTQFYGNYLFHSVLYYQGTRSVMDGRLGQHLSHGCVRLHINNAKWIYDNIPRGTRVLSY